MTYMFISKCALKLVEEIILYYDARSKKHQILYSYLIFPVCVTVYRRFNLFDFITSVIGCYQLINATVWTGR